MKEHVLVQPRAIHDFPQSIEVIIVRGCTRIIPDEFGPRKRFACDVQPCHLYSSVTSFIHPP